MHLSATPSRIVVLSVTLTFTLAGCGAGHHVRTDFDPQASFTELQRYAWADSREIVDESPVANPFLARRIRRAVDQNLAARGASRRTGRARW